MGMSNGKRVRWLRYGGFCLAVLGCLFAFLVSGRSAMAPIFPGNYSRTFTVHGTARGYLLHVPGMHLFSRRQKPLVMLLHGAGADGITVSDATGMAAFADREQFYLVCPNATGPEKKWNTEQLSTGADDVAFLTQLLDQLCAELPVDRSRVYLAGYSCGGAMCSTMAVAAPHRFAAVGSVCGMIERSLATRTLKARGTTAPTPVLLVHGDKDPDIPFEKSTRYTSYPTRLPVHDTVRFWLAYNRCAEKPTRTSLEDGGVTVRDYPGTAAPVRLLTVHGASHDWPGSTMEQLRTRPELHDLMLQTLWEFFRTQARS
jgi:polyhydroxybutyrate depolymerase